MNTIIDNTRPNMIAGVTKPATRLPVGALLVADAEAPALKIEVPAIYPMKHLNSR